LWIAICPISGSGSSATYCHRLLLQALFTDSLSGELPLPLSAVHSKHPALFAVCSFQLLVYYSVFWFYCRAWVSLSRGLCWFISGVAVGVLCAAYLLTCWSVSLKQVWSQRPAVREPSCFLSVTWQVDALCGLGVRSVRVLVILGGFFSAKCGSSS
jgi:hypothetical protein